MHADTIVARVSALLEAERSALLSGRVEALPELADRRLRLMSDPHVAAASDEELRRLGALLERNMRLARAAAAGIRDAARRVREIRTAAGPIGSYGARGERVSIGTSAPVMERNA